MNPGMEDTLTSRLTTLAALGSVNTDLRAFVQEVAMPEIQLERLSLTAYGLVISKPNLRLK